MSTKVLSYGDPILYYQANGANCMLESKCCSNDMMRTVGGPEVSVLLNLCQLGHQCEFATVLPNSYLGDFVDEALSSHGIDLSNCKKGDGLMSEGTIKTDCTTFYQRDASAFSLQSETFDWDSIVTGETWVHLSYDPTLISGEAEENWKGLLKTAAEKNCNISVDCSITENVEESLPKFWNSVKPYIQKVRFLYLSNEVVKPFAELMEVCCMSSPNPDPKSDEWCKQCCALYNKIKGPIILTTFVIESGLITELFSLACQGECKSDNPCGTKDIPVYLSVTDPRGRIGGYIAGVIDFIISNNITIRPSNDNGYSVDCPVCLLCRRGDIVSSFTQLCKGEQIEYNEDIMHYYENAYTDIPILINIDGTAVTDDDELLKRIEENNKRMKTTKETIDKAKICCAIKVAYVERYLTRAKNYADRKIKMFSINSTSDNLDSLMKRVFETLPKDCVIGIHNVNNLHDLCKCIKLGIHYVVCPFLPTFDFISEAHKFGVVIIVSAMSIQEISDINKTDTDYIQIYPSMIYTPFTFKEYLDTKMWGDRKFILDHGTLDDCLDWLHNGFTVVFLDQNFIGEDCCVPPSSARVLSTERTYNLNIKDFAMNLIDDVTGCRIPKKALKGADRENDDLDFSKGSTYTRPIRRPAGGTDHIQLF